MPTERSTLLADAQRLLSQERYSHEDAARVTGILALFDRLNRDGNGRARDPELESFAAGIRKLHPGENVIHWDREQRDMSTSALSGGGFVPQGFRDLLQLALAQYDPLFNPDVVTVYETTTGAPTMLPAVDDTASAATIISEGAQSVAGDTNLVVQQTALSSTPTYRSGFVKVSMELVQDSRFPILAFLAAAFAVRLARGIGASLVSTLLSSALKGTTATGSGKNTGGTETGATSVGWTDLINLRTSVDPAYRATPKCAWLMNDDSIAFLDSILDKQGRPIIRPHYDDQGRRILMGFPVRNSPSMPSIGASATPIAFGALGYFVLRLVDTETQVQVYTERFIDYGQFGFEARLRAQGALLSTSATQSPVKVLANASS